MVAPLIVGAARAVGSKAATGSGRKAIAGSKVRRRARKTTLGEPETDLVSTNTQRKNNFTPRQNLQNRMRGINDAMHGDANNGKKTLETLQKRVTATQAGVTIFWSAIPFFIPQIAFWMIGIIGIGVEGIPLFKYVFPGEALFFVTYACILLIGVCTMVYAVFIFMVRKIDCFGGKKNLIFILCLTGYLVVFLNFFPWFILWLLSVAYLQNEDAEDAA